MSKFVPSSLRLRIVRSTVPFLFALWVANSVQAQSGITLVQHANKDAGTTTASSLAFSRPNTAGNWIAVCVRAGYSSSQVFTIKDSNANTYHRAAQVGMSSAVSLAIFYAENIKGGPNTVSVWDSVSAPLRFVLLEYSGVAPTNSLDAAVKGTGTSIALNSGSLTTTANGDLLLADMATPNVASFTAGSGYALTDFVPAEPNTKLISEQRIQPTAEARAARAVLTTSVDAVRQPESALAAARHHPRADTGPSPDRGVRSAAAEHPGRPNRRRTDGAPRPTTT